MSRCKNVQRSAAVVLGLSLAIAMFSKLSSTRVADGSEKAVDGAAPGKFIVHEWGTFTSFSGSNGVQLDFRPLVDVDLPSFVFDRDLQMGEPLFSKSRIRARVRMETPVTYFYTDQERTVRASVEFPEGLLTEFYPPVASLTPESNPQSADEPRLAHGKLDWGEVHLIPAHALAPALQDNRTKAWLQSMIEERILPNDGVPTNHYYQARETDSAFVHVRVPRDEERPFRQSGDYIEKFLFYRGVGKFDQPLQVFVADEGRVRVKNSCQQPIRSLFRVSIAGPSLTVSELDQVGAGESINFPSDEKQVTSEGLQAMVVEALVREHLYPREALAMVKTWAESWFAEEGTRIFYMVPQETTDRILPLTISPAPDETVRVLVGRVEVMSPTVERDLLEVVRLRAMHRATLARRNAEREVNEPINLPIPMPLKKLGRLAEPALVRLHQLAKDNSVSNEAAILLRECQADLENQAANGDSISKR